MKIQHHIYSLFATACLSMALSLTIFAQAPSAQVSCEALAKLALPQTKITSAQIVPAGEFTCRL